MFVADESEYILMLSSYKRIAVNDTTLEKTDINCPVLCRQKNDRCFQLQVTVWFSYSAIDFSAFINPFPVIQFVKHMAKIHTILLPDPPRLHRVPPIRGDVQRTGG